MTNDAKIFSVLVELVVLTCERALRIRVLGDSPLDVSESILEFRFIYLSLWLLAAISLHGKLTFYLV